MAIKQFFAALFLITISHCNAASCDFTGQNSEATATSLLNSANRLPTEQRVTQLSSELLNKPYQIEPLGEGPKGQFNQEVLYRFDCFDCETYVNTVLALTLARNLADFQTKIQQIVYHSGQVSFFNRSHFPDQDWIPNNTKNGFIKEITQEVAGNSNTALASAFINRKSWYQQLTPDRIKIANLSPADEMLRLQQLHNYSKQAVNSESSIKYIPINTLLSTSPTDNEVNWPLLKRIPNGSIVFFIHHDPTTTRKIGTELNVTHMGFIIWQNNIPYLRAASSLKGTTVDLPLVNYLQGYRNDKKVLGIALFEIRNPTCGD